MLFLAANWKTILGVIATAALCYLLHTVDVDRIEADNAATVKAQIESDKTACINAQNITKGVDDGLSKNLTGLDADYAAALGKLRQQSAAPSNPAAASGVGHGTACPTINARAHGIDSGALLSYAKDAEHYRLQLTSCQTFITDTWATQTSQE